ncbi:MAG: aminomethyl-transferring glycine dehydrogenase subunit GcvPA [Candidatus Omnitrophica bacterium]|nr:aminomethyl-transferring glycine dehydrogenase subunit GcvPA [Candidatus Omnitrophota bacterium]
MNYVPHTPDEFQAMLETLQLKQGEELFRGIPDSLKKPAFTFPAPLTEMELVEHMQAAAAENTAAGMVSFQGGGAYRHFIPQAVPALISRGDFATAYTPYQAEVSQGTLQAIYEFQTYMARLTGMEAANASMYDGASALAEAALMACRITGKHKIAVSQAVNPRYRQVLAAYLNAPGIDLNVIPAAGGSTDPEILRTGLDDSFAAVFIQQPNYFGILEPVDGIRAATAEAGCLLGVSVYVHSLGLLKPPGIYGADMVTGDLQPFGIPLQFGGPYAGFIACKQQYIRQLPGRLVGRTKDVDGRVGYVLTLQTREQHIRRSKATSNICTNQALCALAATIYLALLGPQGLRRAAERSVRNAHILQERVCALEGVKLVYERPFFNEFLLELPVPVDYVIEKCQAGNLLPGIRAGLEDGSGREGLLVCATETTRPRDIDGFVNTLGKILENTRTTVR